MIFDLEIFLFVSDGKRINLIILIRFDGLNINLEIVLSRTPKSKDIFMPSLNGSNSMDIDDNACNQNKNKNRNTNNSNNKNIIQCQPTAQTKDAQNDKLSRILAKLRKNKVKQT